MNIRNLSIYSLTALAIIASQAAIAKQPAYAPELDGGVTASIGTFYAVPSSDELISTQDTKDGFNIQSIDNDYDFGMEASLGYIFDNTANGIELSYRGFNTDTADSVSYAPEDKQENMVTDDLKIGYQLNALDLMISQYLDVGNHVQMRFSAGLAYVDLEKSTEFSQVTTVDPSRNYTKLQNKFKGLGPRLGTDARYDFGQGLGVVGGASFAYYLGDNEFNVSSGSDATPVKFEEENHGVTNLRGNIGLDYVYFFTNDKKSTLGLELGYMVDYYDDAALNFSFYGDGGDSVVKETSKSSVSFAGPYLQLKGTF